MFDLWLKSSMDILQRQPSTNWEPFALPDLPGTTFWAWFRPAAAPTGVCFQIPAETFQQHGKQLSLRRLVRTAGIDPRLILSCVVYGTPIDAMQGASPLLDQVLSPPAPGMNSTIVVYLHAMAPPPVPMPMATAPAVNAMPRTHSGGAGNEHLFQAIESDWNAIRLIEAQLAGTRKQLGGLAGRLQSLNRDLTPDERLASDNQDTREWQDARRWLRDCSAYVSRAIRAYDTGTTSAAGNRNKFDDFIAQTATPRRPTEGLVAWAQQFETHRKIVQSLQTEMQSAISNATRDGEQRAQQLLSRIAAKVRTARTKR